VVPVCKAREYARLTEQRRPLA